MTKVATFTFNRFQENTYVVYDETGDCAIFDPGCNTAAEEKELISFFEAEKLTPVRLINTHCHIDHVLGNKFIAEKYKLDLEIHRDELPNLNSAEMVGKMYQIPVKKPPSPAVFLEDGDTIEFGKTKLEILFTPGHSAGGLSFFCEAAKFVIAGDTLFYQSIGRTDLPGGDYNTQISSIKEKLFSLGDDVTVYSGHMRTTTIGHEREYNPFLK